MAKSKPIKKKSKEVFKESTPLFDDLSPHAKQAILAVFVAIIGVFFAASLFDLGGWLGGWAAWCLMQLFGTGEYLAPLVCAFYVYALLNPR
jgi:ABC-type transport system involved in cytochrome bd biosynthesis fused ATPase/permease subunit